MSRPNLTITQPTQPAGIGTRSSPRVRSAVDPGPVVSTAGTAFSDALTLAQRSSGDAHQAVHSRRRKNAEVHEGSLAALLPDTQTDEQGGRESASEAEDDDTQHQHGQSAGTAPAASSSQRTPRVVWKPEMEEQLQNALLAYVTKHGRLPPQMKTGKGAVVSAAWKEIVAEVPLLKLQVALAAKACSTKWAKIKKDLKVHSSLGLPANQCQTFCSSLASVC